MYHVTKTGLPLLGLMQVSVLRASEIRTTWHLGVIGWIPCSSSKGGEEEVVIESKAPIHPIPTYNLGK